MIAAVALVAVAGVEGSRFDGYAQLHPMHPVHLIGRDGGYTVMPLAWIDPHTAAWTQTGDRAAAARARGGSSSARRSIAPAATYCMYGGTGSLALGDRRRSSSAPRSPSSSATSRRSRSAIVGSVFFGWRDNQIGETLFESRYTLELQGDPDGRRPVPRRALRRHRRRVPLRGRRRRNGNSGSRRSPAARMFQLDINTRIALTARFGLANAHERAR